MSTQGPWVIKWNCFKSFNQIDREYESLKNQKGVYLWVYNGQPKRVVYVGTGTGEDGLFRRLCIEKVEMLCGKHYCFKYNPLLDAYEKYLTQDEEKIKKLVIKEEFYYPDSNIEEANNFSTADFLKYQKGISVYIADLREFNHKNKIDDISKTLESQLQIFLLIREKIGYYRKWGFQSWLGKVEKLRKSNFKDDFEALFNYNFQFSIQGIKELTNFSSKESLNAIKQELCKKYNIST